MRGGEDADSGLLLIAEQWRLLGGLGRHDCEFAEMNNEMRNAGNVEGSNLVAAADVGIVTLGSILKQQRSDTLYK